MDNIKLIPDNDKPESLKGYYSKEIEDIIKNRGYDVHGRNNKTKEKDGEYEKLSAAADKLVGYVDLPPLYSLPKKQHKLVHTDLKEHSVYAVRVAYSANNPFGDAILLTGFQSGAYWVVVSNSCGPTSIDELYAIYVIKELYTFGK